VPNCDFLWGTPQIRPERQLFRLNRFICETCEPPSEFPTVWKVTRADPDSQMPRGFGQIKSDLQFRDSLLKQDSRSPLSTFGPEAYRVSQRTLRGMNRPMRRLCNQGTCKQAFTQRRLCVPIVSVLKREARSAASIAQRRHLRPTQPSKRGRSRSPVSRLIRPRSRDRRVMFRLRMPAWE
jgi:hypothetical protein